MTRAQHSRTCDTLAVLQATPRRVASHRGVACWGLLPFCCPRSPVVSHSKISSRFLPPTIDRPARQDKCRTSKQPSADTHTQGPCRCLVTSVYRERRAAKFKHAPQRGNESTRASTSSRQGRQAGARRGYNDEIIWQRSLRSICCSAWQAACGCSLTSTSERHAFERGGVGVHARRMTSLS